MLANEIAPLILVLIIGFLVLGWRSWGPGLQNVDRERAGEDAAREFFDAQGRWPDEPALTGEPCQRDDPER